MPEGEIGLTQTIMRVGQELAQAIDEGRAQDTLSFKCTSVELELEIAVSNEVQGKGGLDVWVVSSGAQGTKTPANTHRVKLTLAPIDPITADPASKLPKQDPQWNAGG
jgi:hypothetical protein